MMKRSHYGKIRSNTHFQEKVINISLLTFNHFINLFQRKRLPNSKKCPSNGAMLSVCWRQSWFPKCRRLKKSRRVDGDHPKVLLFSYFCDSLILSLLDPAPNLPYYIRRSRYHLPALYLERRRDQVNPKTMLYEYVELVTLRGIFGDVFVSFIFFQTFVYLSVIF